jgi:hypothetical protein
MRIFNKELNSLEVYRFLFHAIALALIIFGPVLLRSEADLPRRLGAGPNFWNRWQLVAALTGLLYLSNVYLLIPFFLKPGKYIKYVVSLAVTLLASTYLMNELLQSIQFSHSPFIPEGLPPRGFGQVPGPRLSIVPIAMSLALGISFEMILNWEFQRKEKIQIEREKMAAELSFLKSQVNPHFLFNSLNSIYALSEQKSDQTSEAILLLSNLMRYMLYGSNNGKTQISKEIECVENFIQLQRLRISSRESIIILVSIKGRELNVLVEPLILIPFIENAFKHGVSYHQRSEVLIDLNVSQEAISLVVRNTKKISVSEVASAADSGIGLANIKRRLDLLYPSRHTLHIEDGREHFSINLKIQP